MKQQVSLQGTYIGTHMCLDKYFFLISENKFFKKKVSYKMVGLDATVRFFRYNQEIMDSSCGNNLSASRDVYRGDCIHLTLPGPSSGESFVP